MQTTTPNTYFHASFVLAVQKPKSKGFLADAFLDLLC